MRARIVALPWVIASAGCGGFLHATALDEHEVAELHRLGAHIASRPVSVEFDGPDEVFESLRSAGFPVAWVSEHGEAVADHRTVLIECGPGGLDNLGLTYLSLGIVPMPGVAESWATVTVTDVDGEERTGTVGSDCWYVAGWFGCLFGALPGWETFSWGLCECLPVESPEADRLALEIARAITSELP